MTQTIPINKTDETSTRDEDRQQAQRMYDQGESIGEIANQLDRAYSTVWNWFNTKDNSYRILSWKGKATDVEKQQAVDAYERLGTIAKVCEEVDRNYNTVSRWLKEAQVDTSRPTTKSSGKKTKQLKNRVFELEEENARLKEVIQILTTK